MDLWSNYFSFTQMNPNGIYHRLLQPINPIPTDPDELRLFQQRQQAHRNFTQRVHAEVWRFRNPQYHVNEAILPPADQDYSNVPELHFLLQIQERNI